jgi:hypothetical protein
MVQWYGAMVWCNGMVQWYGAMVWCNTVPSQKGINRFIDSSIHPKDRNRLKMPKNGK